MVLQFFHPNCVVPSSSLSYFSQFINSCSTFCISLQSDIIYSSSADFPDDPCSTSLLFITLLLVKIRDIVSLDLTKKSQFYFFIWIFEYSTHYQEGSIFIVGIWSYVWPNALIFDWCWGLRQISDFVFNWERSSSAAVLFSVSMAQMC